MRLLKSIRDDIIEGSVAYAFAGLLNVSTREVMRDAERICPITQRTSYDIRLIVDEYVKADMIHIEHGDSPIAAAAGVSQADLEQCIQRHQGNQIAGQLTVSDAVTYFERVARLRQQTPHPSQIVSSPGGGGGEGKTRSPTPGARTPRVNLFGSPPPRPHGLVSPRSTATTASPTAHSQRGSVSQTRRSPLRAARAATQRLRQRWIDLTSPRNSQRRGGTPSGQGRGSSSRTQVMPITRENSSTSQRRGGTPSGQRRRSSSPRPPARRRARVYSPGTARRPVVTPLDVVSSEDIYYRLHQQATVFAIKTRMNATAVRCPNANILGPMTATYRSRVNTTWAVIKSQNANATTLDRWMNNDIGRFNIANYIKYFVNNTSANYMTAHETRTLDRDRASVLWSIRNYVEPPVTPAAAPAFPEPFAMVT